MRARALLIAVCTVTLCGPVLWAQRQTLTGQLVDTACYVLDKTNVTNAHKGRGYACAQACAKEGFSVGLLTSDGKVYQIAGGLAANKNAKLVAHMSQTVRITGDTSMSKEGVPVITSDQLEMTR